MVFTVVGVMPRRFIGADPLQRPQIFVPLATEPVLNQRTQPDCVRTSRLVAHGDGTPAAWIYAGQGQRAGSFRFGCGAAREGSRREVDREPRETTLPICRGAGIGGIQLRPIEISQAARRGVRDVRRHPAAGLPQPGQPADGARHCAAARTRHAHGDGSFAAEAHPAVAGGGPAARYDRNAGWPGDCAGRQQVACCDAAEER